MRALAGPGAPRAPREGRRPSCNLLGPLFTALSKRVRHLIIATVQRPVTGYLSRMDAIPIDELGQGIETLELRALLLFGIFIGVVTSAVAVSIRADCRRLFNSDTPCRRQPQCVGGRRPKPSNEPFLAAIASCTSTSMSDYSDDEGQAGF